MPSKIEALIKLLGDDDDEIRSAVKKELIKLGPVVLLDLGYELVVSSNDAGRNAKIVEFIREISQLRLQDFIIKNVNSPKLYSELYFKIFKELSFALWGLQYDHFDSFLDLRTRIINEIWLYCGNDKCSLSIISLLHFYLTFNFDYRYNSMGRSYDFKLVPSNNKFLNIIDLIGDIHTVKKLSRKGLGVSVKKSNDSDKLKLQDYFFENLVSKTPSVHHILYLILLKYYLDELGYTSEIVKIYELDFYFKLDVNNSNIGMMGGEYFLLLNREEKGKINHYLYDYSSNRFNTLEIISDSEGRHFSNSNVKYSRYIASIPIIAQKVNVSILEQTPYDIIKLILSEMKELTITKEQKFILENLVL